jgi:ankyrin repeat protein
MELVAASSGLSEAEQERRQSLLKVSKVFIQKGIDVNAVDDNNETALFRAVREQDADQVAFLLSAGVDPNIMNKDYETVLTLAVYDGVSSLDVILLLLKYGADPSIKNHKKQSLFEVLNKLVLHTHNKKLIEDKSLQEKINPSGQYLVVLKEVLSYSKDSLDFYDSTGDPIFFEPLLEDHFPMFKIYLQSGVDVHKKNIEGHNLFYKYVVKVFEEDNEDIDFQNNLSVLLSKKVDHNSQDHTGYTVLHKIMHTDCNLTLFDELTEVVLFNYKVRDNLGRSVVHSGVWNDKRLILRRINNIDKETVNLPDGYGILPITYAALLGNKDLVLLFLDMKANIRSHVNIAPQAIEKFRPMLKNLKKLEYGITDDDTLQKVKKVIDQVIRDFGEEKQKIYEF